MTNSRRAASCPTVPSAYSTHLTGLAPLLLIVSLMPPTPGACAPANRPSAANLPADLSLPASELERRTWDKRPLQIPLPVNRERLVTFNVPVRVEMPPDLDAATLRTQIVADTTSGTIYWTALKPFKPHRVQVQDIVSKNIFLVDIAASPAVLDTTRIEVAVPGGHQDPAGQAPATPNPGAAGTESPDPVALTRMAAQQLYAPTRLLQLPDGVYPSPVRQHSTTALYHAAKVEATPVMAWRSGELTVTAVKLKNLTGGELILDPRHLRGRWQTATFQHNLLLPQGSLRDTTAVYLVSTAPFEEALGGY
jgi:integrating conjugative element protein (TIGR03749 family)